MNLSLTLLYLGFFALFFILGLFFEYKNMYEYNDNIHNGINHMIVMFLFFSMLFVIFAGLTLYGITIDYVDASGVLQTSYVFSYQPFAYACFIISFIPGIMLFSKIMDILGGNIKT